MSRAKKMPAKGVEHNPGRAMLGNLVRWRNNRSDLERAIGTKIEATTQVPFWDVRVDIRVKAIGVCYSLAEKITPICADFLVERREFEPLTSAVLASARLTPPPLPVLQRLLRKRAAGSGLDRRCFPCPARG
jgi:hypothetical protein